MNEMDNCLEPQITKLTQEAIENWNRPIPNKLDWKLNVFPQRKARPKCLINFTKYKITNYINASQTLPENTEEWKNFQHILKGQYYPQQKSSRIQKKTTHQYF